MHRPRGPGRALRSVVAALPTRYSPVRTWHLVRNVIAAILLVPLFGGVVIDHAVTNHALKTRGVVADAVVAEQQPDPPLRHTVAIDIAPFGDGDVRLLRHYANRPASWDGYVFSVTYDPLDPDRVVQTGVTTWGAAHPLMAIGVLWLLWSAPFSVIELIGRVTGRRRRQTAPRARSLARSLLTGRPVPSRDDPPTGAGSRHNRDA